MTVEFFSSTEFYALCVLILVAIMFFNMIFNKNELGKLKKCLVELETALIKEDEKINENFQKVHESLNLAEREIKHVLTVTVGQGAQNKQYKVLGKKAGKFLTPKGKIKKHYRDNPIAQQFYAKFHKLQNV